MTPMPLIVLFICALLGRAAVLPPVYAAEGSKQVCDNSGGACFETIFFDSAGDKFSLGFSLPAFGDERGEMIVNASIPLPYGFVSFTFGDQETGTLQVRAKVQPVPDMGMFVDEATVRESNPPPLNLSDVRAQLSMKDGQGHLLPTGSANTSISPMSSRTSDAVDIIMRFQDSSMASMPIFTSESPQLSATFSLNPPHYLDSTEQKAQLNLNGSTPILFTLNGKKARSTSFDAMIEAAGFNP